MVFQLTNTSDAATEKQNTAGKREPILTVSPEEGIALVIEGMVRQGKSPGIPIFGSFYNQQGDPIDQRSELSLRFEQPGDDDATTVTYPLTNIQPYNSLTVAEQQDAEKIDRVKHKLKGSDRALANNEMPQVVVGHLDDLHLTLKSPDVIDWSHPKTKVYFARQAVEEVN
jgi:hypothetical protein